MDTQQLIFTDNSALRFWRWQRYSLSPLNISYAKNVPDLTNLAHTRKEIDELTLTVAHTACSSQEQLFTNQLHVVAQDWISRNRLQNVAYHVCNLPWVKQSFCEILPNVFVLSPEACYAQIITKLKFEFQLILGMEFCGSYAYDLERNAYIYGQAPITSTKKLNDYNQLIVQNGDKRSSKLPLELISDDSASYMETCITLLLSLPYRRGGYGLKLPWLNPSINKNGLRVPDYTPGSYKPDLFWPQHMIAIEYNSKEFHQQRDSYADDTKRRAFLESLGIEVIPLMSTDVYNIQVFDTLAQYLAKRMGKRLRLPADFSELHQKLRATILKKSSY
ncbi:MAG: hypothetical protein IKE43_06140 [Coriobacteriales bacterium]|nr:hypothetical protein [Coriobacteriales bacterium]